MVPDRTYLEFARIHCRSSFAAAILDVTTSKRHRNTDTHANGHPSIRLRDNDRLIEAGLGWKNPASISKASLAQRRGDLIPAQRTIASACMKRLPLTSELTSDVQMKVVSRIINPLPNLEHNAAVPLI